MDSTGGLRVGVAADEAAGDRVAAALTEAGATPLRESPAALADRSLAAVVAVGERPLLEYVRADPDPETPVLPVDAGRGVCSVPEGDLRAAVAAAVDALAADAAAVRSVPLLSVAVGEDRYRALFDLLLVTSEPARISEYAVATGDRAVADVRADGVVVATPAGTHGYAAAVDGPLVAPESGAVAVVPVAPFVTDRDRWVVPADGLRLAVTRDEGAVDLYVDDREVATVGTDREVAVARDGRLRVLVVPQSRAFWGTS